MERARRKGEGDKRVREDGIKTKTDGGLSFRARRSSRKIHRE